jgi:hypothetical protein
MGSCPVCFCASGPLFAQCGSGAKNIDLNFALGSVKHLPDLSITQLFLLTKEQSRSLVFGELLQHVEYQVLSLLELKLFFWCARSRSHCIYHSIQKPVTRLALAKLVQGKVSSHPVKPEPGFLGRDRTPGRAVQLQKTLLRQVLGKRSPPAQQALEEPAKAWIEILKEHGELFVFARHKLRYAN